MNLPAATGDMGILANHVPSIEALRPGVVEVIESGNASKKFFGKTDRLDASQATQYIFSIRRFCHRPPQQPAYR